MAEILGLAKAGYGSLASLLELDSPAILDALEWEDMSRQAEWDARCVNDRQ